SDQVTTTPEAQPREPQKFAQDITRDPTEAASPWALSGAGPSKNVRQKCFRVYSAGGPEFRCQHHTRVGGWGSQRTSGPGGSRFPTRYWRRGNGPSTKN